jgi:hypothetical protein
MPDDVRGGDVNDVRLEFGEVTADALAKAQAKPIFGTARDRNGGDADQLTRRLECRSIRGWRIDTDLDALSQEIADEPVQRLVRTIADVVVIAREEGNPKVARFHGQKHLMVGAAKAMRAPE